MKKFLWLLLVVVLLAACIPEAIPTSALGDVIVVMPMRETNVHVIPTLNPTPVDETVWVAGLAKSVDKMISVEYRLPLALSARDTDNEEWVLDVKTLCAEISAARGTFLELDDAPPSLQAMKTQFELMFSNCEIMTVFVLDALKKSADGDTDGASEAFDNAAQMMTRCDDGLDVGVEMILDWKE